MAGTKQSAADFVEGHDGEMRIILGELAENAGKLNMLWTFALHHVREDPHRALTLLIEAEILLEIHLKIERADSLRRIRSAIRRLGATLPDEDDQDDPGAP